MRRVVAMRLLLASVLMAAALDAKAGGTSDAVDPDTFVKQSVAGVEVQLAAHSAAWHLDKAVRSQGRRVEHEAFEHLVAGHDDLVRQPLRDADHRTRSAAPRREPAISAEV